MNHNQVLQRSNFRGGESGIGVKSPCLINRRKRLGTPEKLTGDTKLKQGKTTLDMPVDVEITPTYNIRKAKVENEK